MNEILQSISLIPPVTRTYLGLCCFVTFLVQFDIITPFHLYFNWNLIVKEFQLWRLISSFLYLGSFGFSFIFNLLFSYRYSRMLEEDSFAFRTADFVFLYLYGTVFMIICGIFTNTIFLGQAFTIMLVYIWGRRNPDVRLNFFGALTFGASYLSYFLFFFSILMNQSVVGDILGISAGHIYYFLEDVYPREHNGHRILKTPSFLKKLFDPAPLAEVPVDERAGGMAWGANGDADDR
uniref:Derlin n=1 Tax=Strongyloides venezuelensis TaxID=75913 RepID=A0A0K0F6Y3_STRVS